MQTDTITYKGVDYPARWLEIVVDGDDTEVLIATESLSDALGHLKEENGLEGTIDSEVYFYVPNDLITASDYKLAKSLDQSFDLVGDYIEQHVGEGFFEEPVKNGSQFKEIKTDYTDTNGVIHIDGYRSNDPNDEGVGIGYFINGEVYWRDAKFQFDPYVQEIVEELKSRELELNKSKL